MALEDFTTYTEVDPGNDIAVTSNKVHWTLLSRASDSRVAKDFGVNHFDKDSIHEVELEYNISTVLCFFYLVSDKLGSWADILSASVYVVTILLNLVEITLQLNEDLA